MAPNKDEKNKDKRPSTAPGERVQDNLPQLATRHYRVLNAKELRTRAYLVGPENVPPTGLGLPEKQATSQTGIKQKSAIVDAVVECGNCGFPVWCQHAEPADEETFKRLKVFKRNQRELAEPEAEQSEDGSEKQEGEEAEEEEEEDDSSLDTVERLESQVEKLNDQLAKLEAEYDKLEEEKDEIIKEKDDLKEKLAESVAKCEFLQESEFRWREKYTNLKISMEERERAAETHKMNIADREFRILRLKAENSQLSLEIDQREKKRREVFDSLSHLWPDDDSKELMILQMNAWRQFVVVEQLKREAMLNQGEIQQQLQNKKAELTEERARRFAAEKTTEHHKMIRWQVGRTKLVRVHLATKLWRMRIFWRAWLQIHPILPLENQLSELEQNHVSLQESYRAQREQSALVLADVLARVEDSAMQYRRLQEIIGSQEEDLLASGIRAREIREAEAQAAAKLLRETIENLQQEAEEKMVAMQKAWVEEKKKTSEYIELLESSLPMDAEGQRRHAKVVAQNKGVICLSCCKQLVHHNVMPLPPKKALLGLPGASEGIGLPDVGFFTKELHSLLQEKKEDFGGYPAPMHGSTSRLSRPASSPSFSRVAGSRVAGRPGTAGGSGNEALSREVAVGSVLPGRPPGVGSRALRSEVNAFRQQTGLESSIAWR